MPQSSQLQLVQSRPIPSLLPKIRVQCASPPPLSFGQPRSTPTTTASPPETPEAAPRRSQTLPAKLGPTSRQTRKRCATIAAGVEAPNKDHNSDPRMPRYAFDGTAKKQCSSPSSKSSSRASPKDVDWADVTDPEERRRIQNRIAQRKFREKARENREKAERESRNQEHAGNSYRVPVAADIGADRELSGLPWGSMSLGLFVSRGHEVESLRSSGRGTYVGDEPYASPPYAMPLDPGLHQTASYGSSGAEDVYYDDANYVYDAAVAPAFPSA